MPNTAEEIKQQSINENNLFIETELKRNERNFETLENIIDEAKHDLIKTFTEKTYQRYYKCKGIF